NNGAYPPDLSLIAKARGGGPDYLAGLMTGYDEPPAGFDLADGMSYNRYFPGHQIAMPNPLADGLISYDDGAPETAVQYAHDVSAIYMWAAQRKREVPCRAGLQVVVVLIVLSRLLSLAEYKAWSDPEHCSF